MLMTELQTLTYIRALAAVGWADGGFSETEKDVIRKMIIADGYTYEKKIREILEDSPYPVDYSALKKIDPKVRFSLVETMYYLASSDTGIISTEEETLKWAFHELFPGKDFQEFLRYMDMKLSSYEIALSIQDESEFRPLRYACSACGHLVSSTEYKLGQVHWGCPKARSKEARVGRWMRVGVVAEDEPA